ncbi:MAG: DUF362 domain-containing protein [Clostridia bacterium]|nr:DUF362 domain-containing protein [Clostridia bacterium]
MTDVSIVRCGSYDEAEVTAALKAVLEPLGGLEWVRPGMKIAVKANLVTFMKPESAATTHPSLLCALVRMLRERGAEVVVGDSPGGLYNAAFVNRVYAATGMKQVEQAGAKLNHNFGESRAVFSRAKVAKEFVYTAWLDDCDAIIDFCKLKSHGMMSMSAAVKNLFGTIPGTLKPEYHFKYPDERDFADMLVDLNEYFKPRLSIADAVVGMEGNGPTAGEPRKIGALMASESPYHLDLVCADVIGVTMNDVPTIRAAHERGLCPATSAELNIAGDLDGLRIPDFKNILSHRGLQFQGSGSLMSRLTGRVISVALSSKPDVVEKNKCVGCGVCAGICPAHAIAIRDKLPKIDRKKCIRCFCCQEFCPKGAMVVKRPLIAKLLNRN